MIILRIKSNKVKKAAKIFFWFCVGALLGLFLFVSFTYVIFQKVNSNLVYPGISVDGIDLSGKTEQDVQKIFSQKNDRIANIQFILSDDTSAATVSAKDLDFGYNQNLIAKQAISIGRSDNLLSNISLVFQIYTGSLKLNPSYHYSEKKLQDILSPFIERINKDP